MTKIIYVPQETGTLSVSVLGLPRLLTIAQPHLMWVEDTIAPIVLAAVPGSYTYTRQPPVYTSIPAEETRLYMGGSWPPTSGDPCMRVPGSAPAQTGCVSVYPQSGRPGVSWWLLDGLVYVQDAGVPDQVLQQQVPGGVLETVPDSDGGDGGVPPWMPPPGGTSQSSASQQ